MWTIEHDGYELTVHHSAFWDYGFRVDKDGETLFNNPCFLSAESYGFHYDEDE